MSWRDSFFAHHIACTLRCWDRSWRLQIIGILVPDSLSSKSSNNPGFPISCSRTKCLWLAHMVFGLCLVLWEISNATIFWHVTDFKWCLPPYSGQTHHSVTIRDPNTCSCTVRPLILSRNWCCPRMWKLRTLRSLTLKAKTLVVWHCLRRAPQSQGQFSQYFGNKWSSMVNYTCSSQEDPWTDDTKFLDDHHIYWHPQLCHGHRARHAGWSTIQHNGGHEFDLYYGFWTSRGLLFP